MKNNTNGLAIRSRIIVFLYLWALTGFEPAFSHPIAIGINPCAYSFFPQDDAARDTVYHLSADILLLHTSLHIAGRLYRLSTDPYMFYIVKPL